MEPKLSPGHFMHETAGELREKYKIGNKLGVGAFSTVRIITHRETGEKRSLKIVHKKSMKTDEERGMAATEVSLLKSLDHPNIVKLHEYSQDSKNFYIVTEYCSGGELFDKIVSSDCFSEKIAANYMKQILGVLCYLHKKNIVHRDVKPENLLLTDESPAASLKLIDFGSSRRFREGEILLKKLGTPYYIAPEVLARNYNHMCDLWSAGVNMYILLCGFPPFGGDDDHEIIQNVKRGTLSFPSPEWDNISSLAKDLIHKLLVRNPEFRISAQNALKHPWVTQATILPISIPSSLKHLMGLRTFRPKGKLKKVALMLISERFTSAEEKDLMRSTFLSLDTDCGGGLTNEKLKYGFCKLFGSSIFELDSEIKRILTDVDLSSTGEIALSDFISAVSYEDLSLTKDKIEYAFSMLDRDKTGSISPFNLKQVFGHRYEEVAQELNSLRSGSINLQEFTKIMVTN